MTKYYKLARSNISWRHQQINVTGISVAELSSSSTRIGDRERDTTTITGQGTDVAADTNVWPPLLFTRLQIVLLWIDICFDFFLESPACFYVFCVFNTVSHPFVHNGAECSRLKRIL